MRLKRLHHVSDVPGQTADLISGPDHTHGFHHFIGISVFDIDVQSSLDSVHRPQDQKIQNLHEDKTKQGRNHQINPDHVKDGARALLFQVILIHSYDHKANQVGISCNDSAAFTIYGFLSSALSDRNL